MGTDPDTQRLYGSITEWMRGGPSYATQVRLALAAPLAHQLPDSGRVAVIGLRNDPWLGSARALATSARARFREAADSPEAVAQAVVAALGAARS